MNQQDLYFKELVNARVDGLLQDDSYYESRATPLKNAQAIKAEERGKLSELLELKELRSQMDSAEKLIRTCLGKLISKEQFDAVIDELDKLPSHFQKSVEIYAHKELKVENERAFFLQEMCGFSNQSLMHCYTLARDLAAKKEYENAVALLVFLEMLAPYVASYWIAHGLCLQALNKHSEAVIAFSVAKATDRAGPDASYWLAKSYLVLNDKNKAQHELKDLRALIAHLNKDQETYWLDRIKKL